MLIRSAVVAVAGWLVLGGLALADSARTPVPEATDKPLQIGRVSHDVSPVGFVYTEAPGAPGVPPDVRRPRHHRTTPAKPVPTRHMAGPGRTAAAN